MLCSRLIPLQQGLRLAVGAEGVARGVSSRLIPLQQGLRRIERVALTSKVRVPDSFHYNKD